MIINLDKNIFGLDISDRALRLVQLKKNGKKILISTYNEIAIPPEVIVNGEIKQEEKLIPLLQNLTKNAKGKKIIARNVITVLPESKTFIKVIDVNATPNNRETFIAAINEEIKNHIPLTPEEIYLDWQILKKENESTRLLIGAAPRNVVNSYLTTIEKAGLTPLVFEIEAAAIARAIINKAEKKSDNAKIIIDFGAARTGLIIYDRDAIPFTVSLPISGIKITDTIATTLKLSWEQAEEAKIICGLDPQKCEGALLKILLKNIENLIAQIEKAIIFYKTNFPGSQPISEVIVCGGGANFYNINQILSERLNIPVKTGNPSINLTPNKKLAIPENKVLSFTTALGLALRATEKKNLL